MEANLIEAKGFTEEEIVEEIKLRGKNGKGLSSLSENLGFNKSYLYQLVSGNKGISDGVALALGYQKVVVFVPVKMQEPTD